MLKFLPKRLLQPSLHNGVGGASIGTISHGTKAANRLLLSINGSLLKLIGKTGENIAILFLLKLVSTLLKKTDFNLEVMGLTWSVTGSQRAVTQWRQVKTLVWPGLVLYNTADRTIP